MYWLHHDISARHGGLAQVVSFPDECRTAFKRGAFVSFYVVACRAYHQLHHILRYVTYEIYVALNILGIITTINMGHFLFDLLFSTSLSIICPHTVVDTALASKRSEWNLNSTTQYHNELKNKYGNFMAYSKDVHIFQKSRKT